MIVLRTKAEVREHVAAARAAGRSVALVPTMGAFHAGHHALMRAARDACDEVVVSLFVNPAQFNEASDLAAYPRSEEKDGAEAAGLGVDVLFAPAGEEIYPDGFATSVRVDGLGEILEGAERGPGHFAGVCTVVAKLFNVVAPDVAYFGQKDAQQVAVLRRMGGDLDFPLTLEVLPTVRDPDGLALSSRNVRLSAEERDRALALNAALHAAAQSGIEAGEEVLRQYGVTPEYFAAVDPERFTEPGDLIVIAATIGTTRLIDNAKAATPERRGADPKGPARPPPPR